MVGKRHKLFLSRISYLSSHFRFLSRITYLSFHFCLFLFYLTNMKMVAKKWEW
jgi:hypothetical protein